MSDLADGLKERAQLLRAWGKFELGMTPPAALDYQDTVEKLEQAAARIEALEATGKWLAQVVGTFLTAVERQDDLDDMAADGITIMMVHAKAMDEDLAAWRRVTIMMAHAKAMDEALAAWRAAAKGGRDE